MFGRVLNMSMKFMWYILYILCYGSFKKITASQKRWRVLSVQHYLEWTQTLHFMGIYFPTRSQTNSSTKAVTYPKGIFLSCWQRWKKLSALGTRLPTKVDILKVYILLHIQNNYNSSKLHHFLINNPFLTFATKIV